MAIERSQNLIIGCGVAGKIHAWTLAKQGQKTVVVERSMIGGSCVNVACLPSKNVIYSAKAVSLVHPTAGLRVVTGSVRVDMAGVARRKRQMVEGLIELHLGRFKASGAELVMGEALFTEPKTVQVTLNAGGTRLLRGERVFLDVGTRASMPDVPGLATAAPMTHVEALNLERLPDRLVILGGGYVGLEFAQAMRRFGSRVTIVQRGPDRSHEGTRDDQHRRPTRPYRRTDPGIRGGWFSGHATPPSQARDPPPGAIGRHRENRLSKRRSLISPRLGGSTMLGSNWMRAAAIAAILIGIAGLSHMLARPVPAAPADAHAALLEFTPDGKLKQPVGYRKWVYVGEVITPNDMNNGVAMFPEFHAIYMDPESFAEYEKTGKYRDGTVVIKELSSVGSKKAASGNGYFQGKFTGLEAAIKDSKRFKDEPGNWAYFDWGHNTPLQAAVSKNAAADCNSCHQNNAKEDWVFSQYYPVLSAAAPHSK